MLLVVSELCEAMEAERKGRKPGDYSQELTVDRLSPELFAEIYRGGIEEEIADAVIRLADIAGMIGMNLAWWVRAKMDYNHSREYKHGKNY